MAKNILCFDQALSSATISYWLRLLVISAEYLCLEEFYQQSMYTDDNIETRICKNFQRVRKQVRV
jgi:hypothetical protein